MQTQITCPPAPRRMEHRWGERLNLDIPARLLLQDGAAVEGAVRNASISGALLETARPIPVYTPLSVLMAAPRGTGGRMLELPACVVRVAREGVAVEWRDMAIATLVELLREAGGHAEVPGHREPGVA